MIPARLLEDHAEALPFWRELGIRGGTCLHLTRWPAVSDRGFLPAAIEALEGRAEAAQLDSAGVDARNFLVPALLDGTIAHLIWVLPSDGYPEHPLEWARLELQGWLDLGIDEYDSLDEHEGRVHGTLLGRQITICRVDYLPVLSGPVMLDVDVSYMLDGQDRVWTPPSELARQIAWVPATAVTVSQSIERGYVPHALRYLGEMALRLLSATVDEAEALRLRDVDEALVELRHRQGSPEEFERLLDADLPDWLQAGVLAAAAEAAREGPDGPRSRRLQDLDPRYCEQPLARARMCFYRGRDAEALEACAAADRDGGGGTPRCRLMHAILLGRLERWDEAVAVFGALGEDPSLSPAERAEAHASLGDVLTRRGRFEEAIASLRRAVELDGARTRYLRALGLALARAARPAEAELVLQKAIRLRPDRLGTLEAHMELAHLYRLDGREDLARAELRQVQRKDRSGLYSIRESLVG